MASIFDPSSLRSETEQPEIYKSTDDWSMSCPTLWLKPRMNGSRDGLTYMALLHCSAASLTVILPSFSLNRLARQSEIKKTNDNNR